MISLSFYHTEGNVKARLFVDGYLGYSGQWLTNQVASIDSLNAALRALKTSL